MITRTRGLIFGGVCLVLGGLLGFYVHPSTSSSPYIGPLRQSDLNATAKYKFIDPLIGLKSSESVVLPEHKELQEDLKNYIAKQQSSGDIEIVSVNFRDVTAAAGFYINADEEYSPASLLKVPLMMSIFNLTETDTTILSQRVYYADGNNANTQEHYASPTQLRAGYYSVNDLMEHLIENSDNNAAELLTNYLNKNGNDKSITELVRDLGINEIDLSNDFITIKAYSLFFRVLFNSTYLSRANSEKALEILSKTDFRQGIVAPLPKDISVAHKFGEFTLKQNDGTVIKRELHDCGLVYYPEHPYLLCIMMKGKNFDSLQTTLQNISRKVYEYIGNLYRSPGEQ